MPAGKGCSRREAREDSEVTRECGMLWAAASLEKSIFCGVAKKSSKGGLNWAMGRCSKMPPPALLMTRMVRLPLNLGARRRPLLS